MSAAARPAPAAKAAPPPAAPAPAGAAPAWKPSHNPWLITLSVMLPTIMEVLDTSVANVALPHIGGNLGASTDESVWVLTSYLVSNAIVLPITGWLAKFAGRKRLLLSCIAVFTAASALCGAAPSLAVLVAARVLQGIGGGALQPISQAILLESFPPRERGKAMAAFIMGIVVAPIIGPTLGGWITDNYSWRWVFYVNVPVGAVAWLAVRALIEDPPWARREAGRRIDAIGFGLLALWIGLLQIVLDKGEQADWFDAPWVRWAVGVAGVALVLFVVRELTTSAPIVDLRVFANRNFATGSTLVTLLGAVLYGSTALLPLFLQTLMGYTALEAGLALSPRGLGAFLTTFAIGSIASKMDGRWLIATGLAGIGAACFLLGRVNLDIPTSAIIWPVLLNGAALSFVFVPLTTTTMGTLPHERLGNATGVYNLMRNLGGSIGISTVTTLIARGSQVHQAALAWRADPFDPAVQERLRALEGVLAAQGGGDAHQRAMALLYGQMQRQAAVSAYVDDFRLMAILCVALVPLAFVFRRAAGGGGGGAAAAH